MKTKEVKLMAEQEELEFKVNKWDLELKLLMKGINKSFFSNANL